MGGDGAAVTDDIDSEYVVTRDDTLPPASGRRFSGEFSSTGKTVRAVRG
jgi:hypothetical protein